VNDSKGYSKLQAKDAGKAKRGERHEIDAERGKTCKRCQATENIQTLRSVGKVANVAKRHKAWKHCPARESMEAMIRAGKRAEVPVCFPFAPGWFKTQHVCSVW